MVERHVLETVRRAGAESDALATVEGIAEATGMSVHRTAVVLERLTAARLVATGESLDGTTTAAITESGRVELARSGGWPPGRS